jgi:hypothetical protein
MSDDLDRAVDARIDAFRPDALPPFSAIEARKRGRDRRRLAFGAGTLAVVAVAGVGIVVPALDRGGDRLTPGQTASGLTRTAFEVRLAQGELRSTDGGPALARCAALPGAVGGVVPARSTPPSFVVSVEGTAEQIAGVKECLDALPAATVREVEAPVTQQQSIFFVRYDGTAAVAAYDAGIKQCMRLPGVTGNSTGEMYPGDYKLAAAGDSADALDRCLDAVPAATVDRAEGGPGEGAGLAAFIARCVGAEQPALTPEYVGLTEDEARRVVPRDLAEPIREFRVVGRDGDCLGRTRDLRSDRVNFLIVDGKILWAGRF